MALYYSSPSKLIHLFFALILNSEWNTAETHYTPYVYDSGKYGLYMLFTRNIIIGNTGAQGAHGEN